MNHLSIAIDGGHSMFKIRASTLTSPEQRISFQIPTVVIPAFAISNEQTSIKADKESVEIDGKKYFFGETAMRQGRIDNFTGQNQDWIQTVQHDVLVLGAWRKVMQEIKSQPTRIHLVMGLPAKYLGAQKNNLLSHIYALLTPKLLPGQTLKILVQSQADAPLQFLAINQNGKPNTQRDLDNESWGVIEIGHFTTDFALSEYGSMVEYAAASCPGVHMVYEAVASALVSEKIPSNVAVVDKVIRDREIFWNGETKNMSKLVESATSGFESLVLDHAERIFGQQAGMLNGIILGGGGAELMFEKIRRRFPSVKLGDDPRMMVAEGFCRLGLMSLTHN